MVLDLPPGLQSALAVPERTRSDQDPRESKNLPAHHILFSGNAAILENLDLRRVTRTMYELMAFPLKLMALDAPPLRAVLRQIVA